jgi:NAD(P)-dependent dehydrogenase (short-subunit alcohol dehydrogenase family)
MKTVVITGGNGSIAKGIADKLIFTYKYLVFVPGKEVLDVTDYCSVGNYMLDKKPDILINCAGFISPASVLKANLVDVQKDIMVNYFGPYMCTREALKNNCSTIINIGSTSGFEGRANWSAYCSSKAALVAFTESLAKEGVNAYGVHPARTKSKMRERLFPGEDQNTLMDPERIGEVVLDILKSSFNPGSQIIVTKDKIIGLPMRVCPK